MNAATGASDSLLALFAKLVVAAAFILILIGGHTTTSGAGMAFPDWPLSHGSLNPDRWWGDTMQRLEHGHRYFAEGVGVMIGVLCAWVWRSKWSVPLAFGGAAVLALVGSLSGMSKPLVVHTALWSSVTIFLALLRRDGVNDPRPRDARWLALAAFVGVLVQAVLGGLRVIKDPAGAAGGSVETATTFRVVHGCFAQLELCLLVGAAAMLSPVWSRFGENREARAIRWLAWITTGAVFLQLVVGASMRHLGAGLAIPTFPAVDGGWWPQLRNVYVDLNFAHTRVGALVVSVLVLTLVWQTFKHAGRNDRLREPAALLLALLVTQVVMGMLVIWQLRPPILTTLHVANGAALLVTTVLLGMRASRSAGHGCVERPPVENLHEVAA